MNSYRAFKLKLPKQETAGEQPCWDHFPPSQSEEGYMRQGDLSVPQQAKSASNLLNTASSAGSSYVDARRERHHVGAWPNDELYRGERGSPYSPHYLSHLHGKTSGSMHFDRENFKFVRGNKLSEILPQLRTPDKEVGRPRPACLTPNDGYPPYLPALIYVPPKDHRTGRMPELTQALAQHQGDKQDGDVFPSERNVTSPMTPSKSPLPNDCDTSSKYSASPGSTDSGYPASIGRSNPEPDSETDSKVYEEKREGYFECSYCKRTFSYLCHLKVHERVHTGEKPYSCTFCTQQFSQLGSLTVHMRIHTGVKPYECSECSKKFRHVNSLRRHQRQVHRMSGNQVTSAMDKRTKTEMEVDRRDSYTEPTANMEFRYSDQPVSFKRRKQNSPRRLSEVYLPDAERATSTVFHERTHGVATVHDAKNSSSRPQKVEEAFSHRSKFLQQLEMKTHNARNQMKKPECESRTPVTTQSNDNTQEQRKPRVKTWRPFTDDQESKADAGCNDLDEVKQRLHASASSWHSWWPTDYTLSRYEKPHHVSRHERRLERSMSPYNDNRHPSIYPQKLPLFWPSPLSLLCKYPTNGAQQNGDRCDVIGRGASKMHENEESVARPPSCGSDSSDGEKREKEGNVSDEGFSSACSTGGTTSRKCSLDGSNASDQSLNAINLSQDDGNTIGSEKNQSQNLVQSNLARSKQILANIKSERNDCFDRKWSEDSGFGFCQKLRAIH